jgi:squalene-hopene/tetraprenyl-beta-curcumene cyclase
MTSTRALSIAAGLALAIVAAPCRANDADNARYAKALEWLLGRQAPNGGFGQIPDQPAGEIGITGLVIKALASTPPAAHVPDALRARARAAAEKAATFLLGTQQADGSFTQPGIGLQTYRTSIAIIALTALDAAKYREPIGKAVAWLKNDQHQEKDHFGPDSPHHGGFGYDDDTNGAPMSDLSNTSMALAALHDAGIPADDPVYRRAMVFLERCQNDSETNKGVAGLKPLDDGGFIYDPGLATDKSARTDNPDGTHSVASYGSMTYSGLMSMIYSGVSKDDKHVQAALRWISANYTLEENRGLGTRRGDADGAQQGLYYYYHAFAKCMSTLGSPTVQTAQGPRTWARDLLDAFAARQHDDGSFVNAKDRWWEADPVLVTAFAISSMNYAIAGLPAGN